MFKNKKLIIVTLLLLCAFLFAGCGTKGETAEQAATNALTAIKNWDKETAQRYFIFEDLVNIDSESKDLIKNEENAKLLTDKLNFTILFSSIEGDTATVKTEVTNIDMASVLAECIQKATALALINALAGDAGKSDEEMQAQAEQIFIDLLKRDSSEMRTSTVDIKLTKTETGWRLNIDEQFKDAVFGGLISISKAMEESIGGGESPESKLKETNGI